MVETGRKNRLRVLRKVDFGVYLDGKEYGDILLPVKYVPEGCRPDDLIEVFIYFDSEDIIIATTLKPFAEAGQIASLKVVSVNPVGAFLDWGLQKDLLVPYAEQKEKMVEGSFYLVFIYIDSKTERIVASSRLSKFLKTDPANFKEEQEVELQIWEETPLGFKAIINGTGEGLIFHEDVFQPLLAGQKIKGFIKQVREDGKIDLIIDPPGYEKIEGLAMRIFSLLKESDGFIPVSGKTPPGIIYDKFGVSKKNYKKAIGSLYKSRLITVEQDGIRLKVKENERQKNMG